MSGFAAWLHATAVSQTIQSVHWIVPVTQSIHIVMIGIVFISSLTIALRVLGRVRADESLAVVWQRFAPWMWSALIVMLLTGVVLVIGEPGREFGALSFWIKMVLIAIAVLGTLQLGRSRQSTTLAPGARGVAVALIVLWVAIIYLGRAIAYDIEVWGALSLHA